MSDQLPDAGAFGAAFEDFIRTMTAAARRGESALVTRIREHVGRDPKELPSTSAQFPTTEHPNLQLALDALLPDAELLGYSSPHGGLMAVSLSQLLASHALPGPIEAGPVEYADVDVGDGRVVRCVSAGVYLASWEGAPVVAVVSRAQRPPYGGESLRFEAISPGEGAVSALIRELRAAMSEHNVYRGRVISLHPAEDRSVRVRFHRLPRIGRDDVVLPAGTLERLERHAVGIADHAERLTAAGRQLKRGVLLHGPPGTGKTLTVNYLLGAMPGRTTVLLTGQGLGLIEAAVSIARELTPATVVLEDVDLVAAERTMQFGHAGILFELLNHMEGLAEDADLLFLLTTNRADVLEPALAARPGRVDLALEIPLPDDESRRKLLRLYAGDIELDGKSEGDIVTRTQGLTGAFVKELMRQAVLRAALENGRSPTSADAVLALEELLEERATLTRRLLGQGGGGASARG